MPKFIEIPLKTMFKTDLGPQQKEQLTSICFDPPMEVTPHPVEVGVCLFTTGFGTKHVCMPYAELMEKLRD